MKRKIVIGIVSKNETNPNFEEWSQQYIYDGVRYAVNKNGGLVIGILPQTKRKNFNQEDESENIKLTHKEKQDILHFVRMCDGIILQGGLTSHNYEEFIAKYCYEQNIPLIGICAGYNNIIRGLGGKAEKCKNIEMHDRIDLKYAHNCFVTDKTSLFYRLVKKDTLKVNSIHTYIGTVIPKELSIVAVDDENQPEVVEAKGKKFYIGVKFHPELLVDENKAFNNLFKNFIDICKR